MTAPRTPNSAPSGGLGSALAGIGNSAPTKPQPAAPLTDQQLRLECVQFAVSAHVDPKTITASAQRFYDYIKNGTVGSSSSVGRNEGA